MSDWLVIFLIVITLLAVASTIFSFLAFLRTKTGGPNNGLTQEQASQLLRTETDRIRQLGEEQARGLRQELGGRLDDGIKIISTKLDQDIRHMREEANRNREGLRQLVENKLDTVITKQTSAANELREGMFGSFQRFNGSVSEVLSAAGAQQKERLDNVITALRTLAEKQEKSQEALRQTVEGRLDAIRNENALKLDEMRKTVDEKLQTTLETRLGESFNRVVEQLERVHKGIGEMQSLASNVGDLKKILSNVRARGTFGELNLGMLLEQFLSPEQFIKNAQVKENSQERVEFAIKLPGRDLGAEVLLPVDAKFPQEDYERLIIAAEGGNAEAVAESGEALEKRIRFFAKTIQDKYINPPRTTDFAILFLPTESLYAEIVRRPGLFEQLQREHHVTLAGPTNFAMMINALQMGFRTLALEKRSSEVWQILGAVRNEFGNYNKVVDRLASQLATAAKSVDNLGVRTRAMDRKLRDVETLPDGTTQILLGPSLTEIEDADDKERSEKQEKNEEGDPGKLN